MAGYAIDINSPAGAALNGVHEGSSAEHSPASSRISSESPTVTPSLTFQFSASPAPGRDGDRKSNLNGSPSTRHSSHDLDAKAEDVDDSAGPADIHMEDDGLEELDIKPDIASLDLASPTAQSPVVAGRRPRSGHTK